MQKRAASKAASRCGADTTTATDGSESASVADAVQQRDPLEIGPLPARARRRSRPARDRGFLVGLVGHRRAPRRGLRRGRAPRRRTRPRAPAAASSPTRSRRRPGERCRRARPSRARRSGVWSTANSLRKEVRCSPGRRRITSPSGGRERNPSLHSIAMGFGGDGLRRRRPRRRGRDEPGRRRRHGRRSSLPDPLDRLWLHPSELSPAGRAPGSHAVTPRIRADVDNHPRRRRGRRDLDTRRARRSRSDRHRSAPMPPQ